MLELIHVSKTFFPGTANARKALDDVSLSVGDGEFISVIGANGAGKSTLFNAVTGNFYIDSGRIFLDGKDITLAAEYRRAHNIGRLYQDPLLGSAPDMSIEENLALAAAHGGWLSVISKAEKNLFREQLARFGMGLENRMQQPVGLLSGGQRQALALLMSTIDPPKLLLLDEHTAALDPGAAEKILSLTEETVRRCGLTCLMITHDMEAALRLGDRTIMMDSGRIILDIAGEERRRLGVSGLIKMFKEAAGKTLANDRMLLR